MTNKREHNEHCKHIADTIERYAYGQMYRCNECGELVDEMDFEDFDELETVCPHCGELASYEQLSMFDYLENALDFEFTVNSEKQYKHGRVMLAYGGPTIYADTGARAVTLYWWNERGEYPLSADASDALDEYLQELFEC